MNTADLIREHLGDYWWEREHDGTAIMAVLDRITETEDLTSSHHAGVYLLIEAEDRAMWQTGSREYTREIRRNWDAAISLLLPNWSTR